MNSIIKKVLEIDDSEISPVLLLLANSFFIGVFLVSYDVAASTLFLDTFGKEYLMYLPILSGGLGMISTSIFAYFQRKIPFTRLTLFSIAITTLLVVVLYFTFEIYQIRAIRFISYLLLGPINSIFLLSFYGTVSRSFSLKREKHMTGTVDQGQMVATTIAYFTIPFVSNFVTDVANFFIASMVSGALAFIFMFVFVVRYGKAAQELRVKGQTKIMPVSQMFANPYVRVLCLLFFGSVITFIFLEFSFLSVTVEKYKDETSLANFLGIFGGLVTLFSMIIQTFVADRVIKMYGMKVSLILIPGILGAFAILASFIGTFFGYSNEDSSFILFFLFMAMSKLFLQTLKEAFEDPIVKTLFIPFDSSFRFDIQTKIEGFFKEFSGFISGALLTLVGFLSFVSLVFYSYFLVAICIFYAYTVIKLFVEYRKTLTKTLSENKDTVDIETKDYEVTDVFLKELQNGNDKSKIFTLKLLERIEPIMAKRQFNNILLTDNQFLKQYSILRIEANKMVDSINNLNDFIKIESDSVTRNLALKTIQDLKINESIDLNQNNLYNLVKSKNLEDRLNAAHLIGLSNNEAFTPYLLILLRDIEPKVRYASIMTVSKLQRVEAWPILIEYLSSYTFCNVAAASLITFGEKVLPALEAAFYKTNQSSTIQEKIVQIYGRIQGEAVIELLWNKIDFPDKKIVNNVLLCLSSCKFRPQSDRIVRIKQQIEIEIGNSAWIVAAITEIPNIPDADLLRKALEEEIEFNFENIYMLLALIYDAQSVTLVKDNINSGTVEGLVYAIELLDVFLSDELKPILFPLIEDIPQQERNERLQSHFPRTQLSKQEVLLQIINRDYNSINKWTKACAIYCYANMPETEMCDDLVANLFNPDPLLREVAAWAIAKKDYFGFKKNLSRLPENIFKELEGKFLPSSNDEQNFISRIQKIFFLKTLDLFKNVQGVILVEFVELIEDVKLKKGDLILSKGVTSDAPIYIIYKGKAVVWEKEDDILEVLYEGQFIGETLVINTDHNPYEITAAEDCYLFMIDRDRFLEQITDNFEIARELISVVSEKLEPSKEVINETKELFN